jgi:hypothetical protein
MSTEDFDAEKPSVHRDRREHTGAPGRPDDDALARRTEQERVDAGLEAYDPNEVPPATDVDAPFDPTKAEDYEEETAVIRRQMSEGELYPFTEKHPFPPTRYEE